MDSQVTTLEDGPCVVYVPNRGIPPNVCVSFAVGTLPLLPVCLFHSVDCLRLGELKVYLTAEKYKVYGR